MGKVKSKPKKPRVVDCEIMTLDEVADFLRVDGATVLSATLTGNLPHVNVAGVYRYSRHALEEWIRSTGERSRRSFIFAPSEPWTPEKEAEVEAEIAEIYARRAADGTIGEWQDAQAVK